MLEEDIALQELLRTSAPDVPHVFQHYLYFPSPQAGEAVAEVLRNQGFTVESRLGADGVNWLVLASHSLLPEKQALEAARTSLERLARDHAGEYDGWEAAPECRPQGGG